MNPLFSGPSTKRSTFYNSSSGRSASSSKQSNVDLGMGQSGQIRSSKGLSEAMEKGVLPTPNKKPRISEPDPFDEFPDEEFTAGDLEAMEIMASQAMSQQENGTRKTKTKSNTATTGDSSSSTSASGSGYNFKPVKNKVSSTASSTVTTDMQGHNQQQKQSNVNYISQGKIQQQTVTGTVKQTSMSTSTTGRKGSHSTSTTTSSRYPLVQSNVNIPSNSFDTHSKEAKTAQESKPLASHQSGQFQKKLGGTAGSVLTPPVGSLARDSPTLPNSQEGRISPSFVQQELDRLKNECAKYKKELSSLHEDRYKKDGEIRMLRENLHKTSTDLNKAQMDKINLTEEQKREKSKKEKELWTEVENLKTQLQFKEMEIVEIQNRYKNLERRVETSSSTSVTTTPKNSPQLFKGLPPQIRANTTSPVKMKDGFPTRQSFLANNQQGTPTKSPRGKSRPKYSPRQKRGPTSPGQASSPMRKISGSYSLDSRQPKLQPVCKLQSSTKKGVCSSAQLVNKLLNITEHQAYNTESSTKQGLITLLQVPTMQSDQHASVDKDYGTTGLKTNRSPSVPSGECWSPLRITSDENHSKAIQTLSQLLTVLPTSTNTASATSTTRHASCSNNASSLGLLPVIQDHLVKYIDMLHTVAEPSVPSTFSGSTASRSVDNNSMESATSSKSQESENWAFVQTEKATLNSLVILQRLICHSCCVRTALLKGSPDNVVESMSITSGQPGRHHIHGDGNASMMEIDPSAPLIPDTAPTQRQAKRRHTSTKKSKSAVSHCQLHNIPVNGILTKVLRIASIHNMYGQSTAMVQATLHVLLSLAKNSEQSMLDRLQPLLTDGTIQNCLSPDNLYSIVSTAIDILNYIVCNKTIVLSLCNQSESCTLSRLYHLCDSGVDNLSDSQWTQLQFKILQFFATLFSCHHSTVTLLVESDCDCSVEVVKALVLMLYKEYIVYSQLNPEKQIDSPSLKVLRHGILLLHYLCVYDRLFISHRVDVEHSYVKLISAMSALYKELTDITDHEATVIQELWDFDQPDEMWSPDGEEEDDAPMETE